MIVVSGNIKSNGTEKQTNPALCCLLSQGHALNTQYCLKVMHVVFKYLNTHLLHTCKIFCTICSFNKEEMPILNLQSEALVLEQVPGTISAQVQRQLKCLGSN